MPRYIALPGGTTIKFGRKLTKAEKKRIKKERTLRRLESARGPVA